MFPGHVASAYPLGRLRCALPSHQNPHAALRRRVDSRNQARRIPHYCVEKLFNEDKSEADVIAARPLKDLDAKWAASDDAAVAFTKVVYNSFKRRWNRSPAAARAGATLSGRGCEIARAPRKSFRGGGAATLP